MAQSFTRRELHALLAPHPAPCISLFLPTHRRPPETEQDPVRFKNLLGIAEGALRQEYASTEAGALLEPLQALLHRDFWHGQLGGLAVFRAPDLMVHYRLPQSVPERAVVSPTFHVTPLIHFLQTQRRFFVLALSQQSVALYEGTPAALEMVDLSTLPTSLTEALGVEQREAFLNLHISQAGRAAPIFHGHGIPPTESEKAELARFFRVIDNALWEGLLQKEHSPLVLAGVGYYHPIYRTLSRYQSIAAQGIEGNVDYASVDELHTKVWPTVSELFREQENHVLNEYARLVGKIQAIDHIDAIAQALVQGRVRYLLVAEDAQVWGTFDEKTGTVNQHPSQQRLEDDLLDDLAECALRQGGEVFLLPADRMPTPSSVAAVLRW
jgi:hypothetical protein